MSRKRTVAVAGITILAGLALVENATRNVAIVPATVIAVDRTSPDHGADQWRIVFELSDRNEYAISGLSGRPALASGDAFCVQQRQRTWALPTFRIANTDIC